MSRLDETATAFHMPNAGVVSGTGTLWILLRLSASDDHTQAYDPLLVTRTSLRKDVKTVLASTVYS